VLLIYVIMLVSKSNASEKVTLDRSIIYMRK